MGTLLGALIAAIVVGVFLLFGYGKLRRARKLQELSQVDEAMMKELVAEIEPADEPVDARPNAMVYPFRFDLRPLYDSPPSGEETNGILIDDLDSYRANWQRKRRRHSGAERIARDSTIKKQ